MSEPRTDALPGVGPVLEASESGRAVVAAIVHLNPDAHVQDRGAYLRVSVPGRCRVTRSAIETALGHGFEWPGGLELVMPAFQGLLSLDEEAAEWRLDRA